MELRQLRYFVAVADTLSFSRAAESLYVSQPALSKQILELEQELGMPLFVRDKRNVELTQAGRMLLPEAKTILMQSEKIVPYLRHATEEAGSERSLHIAVEPRASPLIRTALVDAVYHCRQDMPGLRALFWGEEFAGIKKALLNGSVDLGFFLSSNQISGLELETSVLREEELVLVFRGRRTYLDDRETVLELLNKRGVILLGDEPRAMAHTFTVLDAIGCSPQIRFCKEFIGMSLTMESGESMAIMPQSVAYRQSGRGLQVLHFHHPAAKFYLLAAWRAGADNQLSRQILQDTARLL